MSSSPRSNPQQPPGAQSHPERTPLPDEIEEASNPSTAWWRVAVLGATALVLALGILALITQTAQALALLFIAIVIAEAMSPLVSRLERWLPRGLAVAFPYIGLLGIISGVMWIFVPRLVQQGQAIASRIPDLIERGQGLFDQWDLSSEENVTSMVQGTLERFSDILVTAPMAIATSVTQVVLVFVMSVYWLVTRQPLHDFVRTLVPRQHQSALDDTLGEMSTTVGGYVRGQVFAGAIVGTLTYAGLTIIGVNYALVLAILAVLGELIPVVGPIAAAIPAVIVGFLDSPTQGLIVIAFYLILQQVESNAVVPNVMSNQANIPPLLVIVALFAGGGIGGILGAIVAIPLSGALKVLAVRVAAPAIRRWTGAEEPSPNVARE